MGLVSIAKKKNTCAIRLNSINMTFNADMRATNKFLYADSQELLPTFLSSDTCFIIYVYRTTDMVWWATYDNLFSCVHSCTSHRFVRILLNLATPTFHQNSNRRRRTRLEIYSNEARISYSADDVDMNHHLNVSIETNSCEQFELFQFGPNPILSSPSSPSWAWWVKSQKKVADINLSFTLHFIYIFICSSLIAVALRSHPYSSLSLFCF